MYNRIEKLTMSLDAADTQTNVTNLNEISIFQPSQE
jgi:hypothetical protein